MYIIAVDDEKLALDSLSSEIKELFPSAVVYAEGKPAAALAYASKLAENKCELSFAFLDIQMPGINGIELAKQLKLLHPNVTILFCTAYSDYALEAYNIYAKGYLLKPVTAKDIERVLNEMVIDWKDTPSTLKRDIRVHTFGHFEVFVDGAPLSFERQKAKELLALLIDRRGSSMTTEQIASIIFEDDDYSRTVKNRTNTVISSLRNTLKNANIENILVKTWNNLAIDTSLVKCDAYDFDNLDPIAVNSFHGEYMTNYSWAEYSVGSYAQTKNKM